MIGLVRGRIISKNLCSYPFENSRINLNSTKISFIIIIIDLIIKGRLKKIIKVR